MPERPPEDEDVLALIEQIRARSAAPRDPVARQTERRAYDRRGLGFTARRGDDAERDRQRRAVLLSYLRQLPEEALWLWIDGLWLGCATDAQLDALVRAVQESASQGASGPRPVERPAVPKKPPTRKTLHRKLKKQS